jgi:hypothetical protein
MQFGTMNLFPLDVANNRLSGYFLASDYTVYSTKRSTSPVRMHGSKGYGSYHRTYTLNGQSYTEAYLKGLVTKNTIFGHAFVDHTSASRKAEASVTTKLSNRSHATSASQGVKAKGVVIAQVAVHEGVEHLLFGSKPAIHLTEQSYRDEMTRLASQKPGTKFVALKVVASVISGGVQWE